MSSTHLITCLYCGQQKMTQVYKNRVGSGKYCSNICRGAWYSGKNNPHYKPKIDFVCMECGNKFSVIPAEADQAKHCSRKCHNIYASRINAEKHIKNRIPRNCKICKKTTHYQPSQIATGRGSYCSAECMAQGYSRCNLNTNSYSRTKSGKRHDLGLFFRSSWEANYARYLNLLIAHNGILSWEYESMTFSFPVNRKPIHYTPDFVVYNLDNAKEFHEVKGWMDESSLIKLQRMKKYFPECEVFLLEESTYRQLTTSFSHLIPNWEF